MILWYPQQSEVIPTALDICLGCGLFSHLHAGSLRYVSLYSTPSCASSMPTPTFALCASMVPLTDAGCGTCDEILGLQGTHLQTAAGATTGPLCTVLATPLELSTTISTFPKQLYLSTAIFASMVLPLGLPMRGFPNTLCGPQNPYFELQIQRAQPINKHWPEAFWPVASHISHEVAPPYLGGRGGGRGGR